MKKRKLTGEDYLTLILVKDLNLQSIANWESLAVTTIFNRTCEYIETLEEKEQIEILDEMYFSKKFNIFFTVAREVMIGKDLEKIKKYNGVTQYHAKYTKLLSKSTLLKKEVEKFKEVWKENIVVAFWPKKTRTNVVQTIKATYY